MSLVLCASAASAPFQFRPKKGVKVDPTATHTAGPPLLNGWLSLIKPQPDGRTFYFHPSEGGREIYWKLPKYYPDAPPLEAQSAVAEPLPARVAASSPARASKPAPSRQHSISTLNDGHYVVWKYGGKPMEGTVLGPEAEEWKAFRNPKLKRDRCKTNRENDLLTIKQKGSGTIHTVHMERCAPSWTAYANDVEKVLKDKEVTATTDRSHIFVKK